LGRLDLEFAEGTELALSVYDSFDSARAEGTNQLVFKIGVADEKTERFDAFVAEVRSEPRLLEAAPYLRCFGGVAQTGQLEAEPSWAQCLHETPDIRRASDRHHDDALGVQVPSTPPRQRLERCLVTPALDEDHRAGLGTKHQLACGCRIERRPQTANAFVISWG
jgi:hypothetical protein